MAIGGAVARLFVSLGLKTDEFDSSATAARQKTRELGQGMGDAADQSNLLAGVLKGVTVMALLATAEKAAAAAIELGKLGASSLRVQDQLEAFAGGAAAADDYANAIRRATGLTVDQMSAAAAATKFLQMGLADTAEEMALFAEGATRLGNQTVPANQRLEEMTQLLKNLNPNMLDNFGLSRQIVMARTAELQATQGLTREQGMLAAIQEEITRQLGVLGPRAENAADAIDQYNAAWEDLRLTIGEQLAPSLGELAKVLTYVVSAMGSDLEVPLENAALLAKEAGGGFEEMAEAALAAKKALGWDVPILGWDPSANVKLTGEQLVQLGQVAGATNLEVVELANALGVDLPASFVAAATSGARYAGAAAQVSQEQQEMAGTGLDVEAVLRGVGNAFAAAVPQAYQYAMALYNAKGAIDAVRAGLQEVTTVEIGTGFAGGASQVESRLLRAVGIVDQSTLTGMFDRYTDQLALLYRGATNMTEFELAARERLIINALDSEIAALTEAANTQGDILGNMASSYTSAFDAMRSTVQAALTGTSVSPMDMWLTGEGRYEEKWDESARQLDAIAARGFAELDAHPDWAAMLKIPPDVLAAGEAALKDWAGRTSDAVRALERPDLLVGNIDAAVDQVQDYINRQAAVELSLDIITAAAVEQGLVTGADAKAQVAQALGLDTALALPFSLTAADEDPRAAVLSQLGIAAGESLSLPYTLQQDLEAEEGLEGAGSDVAGQVLLGFNAALAATDLVPGFVLAAQTSVDKNRQGLQDVGATMWDVMNNAMEEAMHESDFVRRFVLILMPMLEQALRRRNLFE